MSDYFENPIQVDKGRLGKAEQGPIDIATPIKEATLPDWERVNIVALCWIALH